MNIIFCVVEVQTHALSLSPFAHSSKPAHGYFLQMNRILYLFPLHSFVHTRCCVCSLIQRWVNEWSEIHVWESKGLWAIFIQPHAPWALFLPDKKRREQNCTLRLFERGIWRKRSSSHLMSRVCLPRWQSLTQSSLLPSHYWFKVHLHFIWYW
jgi:hypothetical protein